jgi:hypothetical protein
MGMNEQRLKQEQPPDEAAEVYLHIVGVAGVGKGDSPV